jgi:hypothetical protein
VKFEVTAAVTVQTIPVGCDHDGYSPLLHSLSQLSSQTVTQRNNCLANLTPCVLVDTRKY